MNETQEVEGEVIESTALVTQAQALEPLKPIMDLAVAKQRLQEFQQYVKFYLVDGEDYGTIPGTPKPTLYKSGADKLCELYGLSAQYEEIRSTVDWEKGLFDYEFRCTLYRGERFITVGMGSCSSYESRYRYRNAERKCPACGAAAIIKGKEEYGGGWVCFKKKGGCGMKYEDTHPGITNQSAEKIQNPDICDTKNTVMKMAKKRAYVDATLAATRSSGIFTQDVEDMPSYEPTGTTAPASATVVHDPEWDEPQGEPLDFSAPSNASTPKGPYINDKDRKTLYAYLGKNGKTRDQLAAVLKKRWRIENTMQIPQAIWADLAEWAKRTEMP